MTREDELSRRDFLTATMASAAALPAVVAFGPQIVGDGVLERQILAAALVEPECAAALGTACLAALPMTEQSLPVLVRWLVAALGLGAEPRASADDFKALLLRRIEGDFAAGEIISVDGWLLSATETRLYALAALYVP